MSAADYIRRFNTGLSPAEEVAFQAWTVADSARRKRDVTRDLENYDLRGYWKDVGRSDAGSQGHMTDRYKKPNHPTFSDESKYHGAAAPWGKYVGGTWDDGGYTPSPEMLARTHNLKDLERYFQEAEPDMKLRAPTNAGSDDWKPPSARPLDDDWQPANSRPLEEEYTPPRVFTGAEERAAEDRKLVEDIGSVRSPTGQRFRDPIYAALARGAIGAGRGMVNTHLNINDLLSNLPGLASSKPTWETWNQEQDLYNRTLGQDSAATFGDLTGQTAMLAPVGGATGSLARLALGALLPGAWATAAPALAAGAEGLAQGTVASGPGNRGEGALTGFKLGLGLGVGAPLVGKAWDAGASLAGRAWDKVAPYLRGGYVRPTPEAQRLTEAGAKITLGQMDPVPLFGRTEELATKTPLGGRLEASRAQGASSIRDVLLRTAGPKSAKPPTAGAPVGQQLEELKAGFAQLYDDALEGARLTPEAYLGKGKWRGLVTDEGLQGAAQTKGAFELAADDPGVNASDTVRQQALKWLKNEATSLTPTKSGPNAGTVDARAVQELRTRLRDEIRTLGDQGDDRATRKIYERAEGFVSELLEGQLPPARAAMLREADATYKNLRAVQAAARSQGAFRNDLEFSPDQLLNIIRSKGATPELEAMARDAHAVLNPTFPMNGIYGPAVTSIPGYKWAGPAWANLANSSPLIRAHALKATGQRLAPMASPLAPEVLAETARAHFGPTLSDLARTWPQASLTGLLQTDRRAPMFQTPAPAGAY